MAQITTKDGSMLLCTKWPSSLPQYNKGCKDIATLHAEGMLIPTHEDALRAWCFVAVNASTHDRSRNKVLAYCNSGEGVLQEVAVRFQGFVKRAELGVYGTWDGNRGTATKAIQAITIGGGIANDTFATQVDVANKLRRYVVEELHGQYNMGKNTATQIEFAHSVFTKVTPMSSSVYSAPVDFSTTLTQQAHKIRQEWQAGPGIRVGVQEQNTVRPASGREIRMGDFVDVTATFNIRQNRRFNATHTYVVLNPVRVVRLATASFVKEISKVPTAVSAPEDTDVARDDTPVNDTSRTVMPVDIEL